MEPENQITGLDADNGFEQGETSFYGNSVKTAYLRTSVIYVEEVLCPDKAHQVQRFVLCSQHLSWFNLALIEVCGCKVFAASNIDCS